METFKNKIVIGCEEWCAFPTLGIPAIKARIDSGAKTSSIHAFNIQPFTRDKQTWVRFSIHPLQRDRKTMVLCEKPVIDKRSVRSSSGESEKRFVIKAPIQMAALTWEVELTLTNRDAMGYRMLLGREAMAGRLLVDPGISFNLGNRPHEQVESCYS